MVRQAALGALLLIFGQIAEFFDLRQMLVISPFRPGIAGLLTARAFSAAGGRRCLRTIRFLRLPAEELVFQLFDLRLQFLDFPFEFGFPLLAPLELGLPIAGLLSHFQHFEQQLRRILPQFFHRGLPD